VDVEWELESDHEWHLVPRKGAGVIGDVLELAVKGIQKLVQMAKEDKAVSCSNYPHSTLSYISIAEARSVHQGLDR
jgi:hypothetical protein